MPTKVPIEIFLIGHTTVDRATVQRWLEYKGVSDPLAFTGDATHQGVSDAALNIALAGKRCYMSFEEGLNPNVNKIRKHYDEYFDNILKSGHGSVLEHSVYNFAIEGVSRVFTAEMNRHRAGWAISEGSLRFIRFGDNIPYWEPDSVQGPDTLSKKHADMVEFRPLGDLFGDLDCNDFGISDALKTLDGKRHATRLILHRAFYNQERCYRLLELIWADELKPESKFAAKKQITSMMRRIIGLGVATGGVWSGNIRALRHVITMRAAPEAEEEMIHVFSRIAKIIRDREPLLFGDFEQVDGYWVPKYKKV